MVIEHNWPEIREHLAKQVCGLVYSPHSSDCYMDSRSGEFACWVEDFRPDENPAHAWMMLEAVARKVGAVSVFPHGVCIESRRVGHVNVDNIDMRGTHMQFAALAAARASGYQEKGKEQ